MAPCYFTSEALIECGFVPSSVGDVDCETAMVLVAPAFVFAVASIVDRLMPRRPEILET
jgi:hypothetical protein